MESSTCSDARLGMTAFTENVAAVASRRWTSMLVLQLVFTLAGTLATRVFHGHLDDVPSVQQKHTSARGEHLSRDAHDWDGAFIHFFDSGLVVAPFLPNHDVLPVRTIRTGGPLDNRPPPSC